MNFVSYMRLQVHSGESELKKGLSLQLDYSYTEFELVRRMNTKPYPVRLRPRQYGSQRKWIR